MLIHIFWPLRSSRADWHKHQKVGGPKIGKVWRVLGPKIFKWKKNQRVRCKKPFLVEGKWVKIERFWVSVKKWPYLYMTWLITSYIIVSIINNLRVVVSRMRGVLSHKKLDVHISGWKGVESDNISSIICSPQTATTPWFSFSIMKYIFKLNWSRSSGVGNFFTFAFNENFCI